MSSLPARLGGIVRGVENAAIALAVAVLVLAAGGEIVSRMAFGKGWTDLDAMLRALVLWIAMLGAMVAAREDRHLAVDALSRYARGGWARLLRLASYGSATAICGLLAWHSFALVRDEYASATIAFRTWRPGSKRGLPLSEPRSFAHAMTDPVNVTAPTATPTQISTRCTTRSAATCAARASSSPKSCSPWCASGGEGHWRQRVAFG